MRQTGGWRETRSDRQRGRNEENVCYVENQEYLKVLHIVDRWMDEWIIDGDRNRETERQITSVENRNHCKHKFVFTLCQQKLQTCVHSDVTKQLGYCKQGQ